MKSRATTSLVSELRRRLGNVAREADESCLVAGVHPTVFVEPSAVEDVSSLLSFANDEGLKVLIRGGGTQETIGFPPSSGDILLSTRALDHLVDYTPHDQTVTAQSGMRFDHLQAILAPAGQWLALDPILPAGATIGGILSTNASGPRRLRYGGVRDQLLGVQVALADGTIARGGGKVVKNVAGYDLPKLYTGALGTLGIVTEASFRVYPRPPVSRTISVSAESFVSLFALAVQIIGLPLAPTALDVFDRGNGAEKRHVLAVRFESLISQATEDQAAVCVTSAAESGLVAHMVNSDEETAIWRTADQCLDSATGGEPVVDVKVSLLPTDIADWLIQLETLGRDDGVACRWRAHAGHGIVIARVTGAVEPVIAALDALREEAIRRSGSLVVTASSPVVSERFDVWGPSPALDLMRGVKAQFDPRSTLNPGRFIGRL